MCENQINSFEKNRPIVISAKEALKITKSSVSGRVEEEMLSIDKLIREAAEDGSYGINIPLLSKEAEDILKSLEYKVTRTFIRNEQEVNISWENFR